MRKPVRIPIRVKQSNDEQQPVSGEAWQPVAEPKPAVVDQEPVASEKGSIMNGIPPRDGQRSGEEEQEQQEEVDALKDDLEMWRDRAMRLQAEIENFRKRQRRLAQDQIEENRARLLRNFLMIADDLERALGVEGGDDGALREGVEVTQRSLKQMLAGQGVERMDPTGDEFDPTWHEAVATVPHSKVGAERDTVVEVEQPGYRLDGRLLRPARVIVAT
ncbi:MAG: nucleotide exchange factor GrpE [Chloroflexota bacterium]